jgi:small multidrug resistance pump
VRHAIKETIAVLLQLAPCTRLRWVGKGSETTDSRGIPMPAWLYLSIAIVSEVIATSALKASEGFSRLAPSVIVVAGYLVAFYFLALTLKTIPVGVAYAIWSGAGVALIALVGWVVFGQRLDPPALIGMALIVAGVVVMQVFSKSTGSG